MSEPINKAAPDDPSDSPVAWFAALERARRTQNYELAIRAQHELRRLGVVVKFQQAKRNAVKGADHA